MTNADMIERTKYVNRLAESHWTKHVDVRVATSSKERRLGRTHAAKLEDCPRPTCVRRRGVVALIFGTPDRTSDDR